MWRSNSVSAVMAIGMVLAATVSVAAQNRDAASLQSAENINCSFPLMVVGSWGADTPEVETRASGLVLEFEAINADEGTAQLASGFGVYDIIVRYAGGYLHFIQSFLDGPLYVTTIMEKATPSGHFKAMHSRHEYTDFALTGFTSSPEQYYGDCVLAD